MIRVRLIQKQLLLPVRVTPRGGKDALLPFETDDVALKIKVSVPPEEGKANVAVIKLLAEVLSVPKSQIVIANGEKSRQKQVGVSISNEQAVEAILLRLGEVLKVANADWYELISS